MPGFEDIMLWVEDRDEGQQECHWCIWSGVSGEREAEAVESFEL